MTDRTLAEKLEAVASEPIEAAVIGSLSEWAKGPRGRDRGIAEIRGEVLRWRAARPLLDYRWDDGYGVPDCHAVTAWSQNWVLFVSEYDGSTVVERIPRHPVPHSPSMSGG